MNFLSKLNSAKLKSLAVASAIVCGTLSNIPGCCIPKLRGPDWAREIPDTFNGITTPDNSAQVGIDEFFNDPLLTCLIEDALVGNQQLKILAEDIQINNNEILKRRGAYLPFVSLGTGAHLNKYSDYTILGADNAQNTLPNGTHFPRPYPEFMIGGDVTWQIDIWRQLRNARDAAALRFLASIEGRNYVVTRLVAEISESYYNLMALDKRLENLDQNIILQEKSLEIAKARKAAARGTELAVQRFTSEVRKNQSEKLIINQQIIESENRINFLVGRFPQPVQRNSHQFFELSLHPLSVGVPCDLLLNRPDIRQAEREVAASGLDVKVARANFYPKLVVGAGVGYEAFNTRYLFISPESLIYNVAGDLVAPLVNRKAIQADYMTANARQLQALYDYQRTTLNAFTEVVNRMTKVENYTKSLAIKKQQLDALEASVEAANNLFQNARVEYIDVLFAQRDLRDARMVYIDTKNEQLSAIVNTYQALGGGLVPFDYPDPSNFLPTETSLPAPSVPPANNPDVVPPADNPAAPPADAIKPEDNKD